MAKCKRNVVMSPFSKVKMSPLDLKQAGGYGKGANNDVKGSRSIIDRKTDRK